MVLRPAYLQLHWNILDFVVVVTSWPSLYAGSGSTFGVLRLLRLLKPLRTIKMIPGMQMLVEVCFAIAEPQAWVFLLAAVSPAALESTQLAASALRASANWYRPRQLRCLSQLRYIESHACRSSSASGRRVH